ARPRRRLVRSGRLLPDQGIARDRGCSLFGAAAGAFLFAESAADGGGMDAKLVGDLPQQIAVLAVGDADRGPAVLAESVRQAAVAAAAPAGAGLGPAAAAAACAGRQRSRRRSRCRAPAAPAA